MHNSTVSAGHRQHPDRSLFPLPSQSPHSHASHNRLPKFDSLQTTTHHLPSPTIIIWSSQCDVLFCAVQVSWNNRAQWPATTKTRTNFFILRKIIITIFSNTTTKVILSIDSCKDSSINVFLIFYVFSSFWSKVHWTLQLCREKGLEDPPAKNKCFASFLKAPRLD